MAGMTFNELPFVGGELSLVRRMHHGGDFVIDPLPNLLFTRDSSFWIGPRVAITSLALPARVRETSLTDLIYAHHPRFLGVRRAYESRSAPVEGGDVLLLAPGVVAVGVGERTTPAGAEALARSLFDDDLAHTVLAVPIAQERAQMHLDTVCTMVDVDAVVMYPNIVDSLSAFTIHRTEPDGVTIDDAAPFVEAAADAMGIDKLRVIDTGLDPVTAEREQWDDGNNTLALAPGVVVAYERNTETNARLADSGIEVLPIAASRAGHRPRRPALHVVPGRPRPALARPRCIAWRCVASYSLAHRGGRHPRRASRTRRRRLCCVQPTRMSIQLVAIESLAWRTRSVRAVGRRRSSTPTLTSSQPISMTGSRPSVDQDLSARPRQPASMSSERNHVSFGRLRSAVHQRRARLWRGGCPCSRDSARAQRSTSAARQPSRASASSVRPPRRGAGVVPRSSAVRAAVT